MTSTNPGAVFFLGTRAHYQILNPPDTISFDIENANASLETIYQNPSPMQDNDNLMSPKSEDFSEAGNIRQWSCKNEYSSEMTLLESEETGNYIFGGGLTQRRAKRRDNESNDFIINDNNDDFIEIDPTALNDCGRNSPKFKIKTQSRRCMNIRALLANLKVKRNKRKLSDDQHDLDNAISMCTYKDSCRCLDCQCRYFECDESDYSDDDSVDFTPQPMFTHTLQVPIENAETSTPAACDGYAECDENEEVFIDVLPADNTSTELLIEPKPTEKTMSVSSEENIDDIDEMQLEMAAGTPVVLDFLLNHPFTCAVQ